MTDTQEDYAGVADAPAHLALDGARLERYMTDAIPGFEGPARVQKFKGGQSNPTYLISTPTRSYVLRRKPPGDLLPSAHAVDREYRVMTALGAQGYPAPKTYALCEDPDVLGTAFFVMDYVEGRIFWDASLPSVASEDRRALFDALTDALAALHRIDPDAAGLSDYGKHGGYFARQVARWTKQYKAAETEPIDDMDRLIAFLPDAVPSDDETRIVHGDYRFDNVIMDPVKPAVRAVLDWELSTLGHPLADFTYYLMVWHFPPTVRGGLAGRDLAALQIPSLDETVARYCAAVGRADLPALDVCLAYNMFRLCAIAQGVYARALQGNASSEQGIKIGEQIKPLAALAWHYAGKAGA
ncbi:MAG: phosphotransferase family protein [Pseudomonadota bacterium]